MIKGAIDLHIGAEVTVSLPATWRFKHYSPEETQAAVDAFAKKLGYDWATLSEKDDEE